MKKEERINAFVKLGQRLRDLSPAEISQLSNAAQTENRWFTEESVSDAIKGIAFMLDATQLYSWANTYPIVDHPKVVGIIMAGNIPMVGFHDMLCTLLAGHFAAIKPSSEDSVLISQIVKWLQEIEPRLKKNIEIRDKLNEVEAVIATGSDNTARYFEYYFRHIPTIIRKNRTSVAVLSGEESDEELRGLGADIFSYFGLGCRNVSKIFTPKDYDITQLFDAFKPYEKLAHHHKYRNNYDYNKSIYLINKTPHLDTGFLLVTSSASLVSPLSVLYHQAYDSIENLEKVLDKQKEKIQCVVSKRHVPFGMAQRPGLGDYADNIDTFQFLTNI